MYKCVARKNKRTQEAVITVKTAEAVTGCKVAPLENGTTDPADEVHINGTVKYKCKKGFKLKGRKT